jgi:hypothetical protein
MRLMDAEARLADLLAPVTVEHFLRSVAVARWQRLPSAQHEARLGLLGADPRAVLSSAVAVARDLTYHSANADEAAPAIGMPTDPQAFRQLIDTFHARRYSVRFPGLRPYSTALDRVCRSLEALLHKPVTASAFWSQGGMKAPVHADDHDLLVIQILGRKRWYVSDAESSLDNTWERIPGTPPVLGAHQTFDVEPGDAVYLPRGTVHAVDGHEESIHVSIGFTPLTVREVAIAAIDHLSDLDRNWRTTATAFLGRQVTSGQLEPLPALLRQALDALQQVAAQPGFAQAALQRHAARTVGGLHPAPPDNPVSLSLDSVLEQRQDSFCHLSASQEKLDVAYPGGHLYIHRGAEAAVIHMLNQPRFRIRDLPGDLSDDVRLSLAVRFVEVGILRSADAVAITD